MQCSHAWPGCSWVSPRTALKGNTGSCGPNFPKMPVNTFPITFRAFGKPGSTRKWIARETILRQGLKRTVLYYDIEFDPKGEIRHIAFRVRQVDLPGESWDAITAFLSESFTKYRIRTIQQQYTVSREGTPEVTLRQALQNLILPTVDYEITLIGKKGKHREGYDLAVRCLRYATLEKEAASCQPRPRSVLSR